MSAKRKNQNLSNLTESEKRKRKREQDSKRQEARISIGEEIVRWKALQQFLGLQNHQQVANLLLNSYLEHNAVVADCLTYDSYAAPEPSTSEPAGHKRIEALMNSEISAVDLESSYLEHNAGASTDDRYVPPELSTSPRSGHKRIEALNTSEISAVNWETRLPEPALSMSCENVQGDDSDTETASETEEMAHIPEMLPAAASQIIIKREPGTHSREDSPETEELAHMPEMPPVAKVTSKQKSPEESPIAPQCSKEPTRAPQINVEPTIVTRTRQKPTKTTATWIAREATTDLQVMQQQTCLDPLSHIQSEFGKLSRNAWEPTTCPLITVPPSTQRVATQPSTTRQVSLGQQLGDQEVRKQPEIFPGVSGPFVSLSGTTQAMPCAVDVRGQMSQANPASTACSISDSTSSNTIMSVDSVKTVHDFGEVGDDIHKCTSSERSTHIVKQELEQEEDASKENLTSGALLAASSAYTNPARKNSQAGEEEILVLTEVKLEQEEFEECRSKQLEGSTNCVEMSAAVASFNEATVTDISTLTTKAVESVLTGAKKTQVRTDLNKEVENKEATVADMPTHTAKEIADHEHSQHDVVLLSKTKHLSDRSSQNAKRRKAQSEIEDYVRPKKFKVRESVDSENKGLSTRTRRKEVRPDYADLNELGGISDLDLDSISESEDTDSEVENIDLLIGEDEFVASSDDTQSLAEENVGTSAAARRKEKDAVDDDPDFDADFDSDDSLREDQIKQSDGSIRDDKRKAAKKRKKKAKNRSERKRDKGGGNTENFEKPKHVCRKESKLNERKNRIKVTLADHPDKYFEEEFVSTAMMDRGKSKEEKTSLLMVCALCRTYKTENVTKLEIHLEHHINDDFKCNTCGIEFETNLERILHNRQKHRLRTKDTFKCPECSEFYYSQQKINNHMSKAHGKNGFVCRFCYMVLASKDELPEHSIERHNGKVKVCPICKGYFKFRSNALFDSHIEICRQKRKKIPCHLCGKELSRLSLEGHVKSVHENERKYNCTLCSYSASDSNSLKLHTQAKHTGEHSYGCDDCDFTCVQKYQLTSHRRTHTGETPFKCDLCPYAAAWNVQLKDHKKLHGLSSSVTCEECGVILKNQKCLNLHNKKEHTDNT